MILLITYILFGIIVIASQWGENDMCLKLAIDISPLRGKLWVYPVMVCLMVVLWPVVVYSEVKGEVDRFFDGR